MPTSVTTKTALSNKRAQTAKSVLLEVRKCKTCRKPAQVTVMEDGIAKSFCIPDFHNYLLKREEDNQIQELLKELGC